MSQQTKPERDIQNAILRELGRGDTRLFRNNVGQGWVGRSEVIRGLRRQVFVSDGDVVIRNARPLHAGLCEGSSDLIGWRSVTITPEMVGQTVAVFAAIEVKSKRGTVTHEQASFLFAVAAAGGFAGVAKSEDEARAILGQ